MTAAFVVFLASANAVAPAAPAPGPAATASTDMHALILTGMFTMKAIDPSVLASEFRAQLPAAALQGVVDDFKARLGAFRSLSGTGDDYRLIFANGTLQATMTLNATGKVGGLLFHDEVSDADTAALRRVLAADHASADWFAASFLSAVPIDTLNGVLAQLRASEGPFQHVEVRDGAYYAVYQKGESHASIATDASGKITHLLLRPFSAKTSSLDDALQKLKQRHGNVSYLILQGRTQVAALVADRPMAIGSSFKLAVLAALRSQISAKRHRWDEIIPLPAGLKSLPSGVLQNWPNGTPLTVATYAAQMISISDNTAADTLLRLVGKTAIERLSPRNAPFLSTRELFALKTKNASVRERYRHASLAERRTLLSRIDGLPAPGVDTLDLQPAYLDIEWYFSVRELCTLMNRVQDLELMTINPGIPSGRWRRIAYKGGSDAGVLNLTSYVMARNGRSYCVSATWNDRAAPLEEQTFESAFGAVLEQLSRR